MRRFAYRKPLQLELGQWLSAEGYRRGDPIDTALPLGCGPEMCIRPVAVGRTRGRGGRELLAAPGTALPELLDALELSFDLRAWLRRAALLEAHWRPCEAHYRQIAEHGALLTVEAVRASRDAQAVHELVELLRVWRAPGAGEFARIHFAAGLLAEATNRARQLAMGRLEPKTRGPALDPRLLPDHRLDHLIQTHRDLAIVDALRAERARRQANDNHGD
jgi:hypothetical protein